MQLSLLLGKQAKRTPEVEISGREKSEPSLMGRKPSSNPERAIPPSLCPPCPLPLAPLLLTFLSSTCHVNSALRRVPSNTYSICLVLFKAHLPWPRCSSRHHCPGLHGVPSRPRSAGPFPLVLTWSWPKRYTADSRLTGTPATGQRDSKRRRYIHRPGAGRPESTVGA